MEAPGAGGDSTDEAAGLDAAAEDPAGGLGALRLRDGRGRPAVQCRPRETARHHRFVAGLLCRVV